MHFIRGLRHRRLALAAIAIFAVAGGVAYAAIPDAGTGVYHACMLKNVGTIRIIDPERQRCSASLEVEITFNKQGPTGNPGPTGPPGHLGRPAKDGEDGQDGAPFSGTFTSPNGQYSLSVTDTGIVLSGAGSTINLTSAGVQVRSDRDLTLQSASALVAQAGTGVSIAGNDVAIDSDRNLTLQSGSALAAQAGTGVSIAGNGVAIRQRRERNAPERIGPLGPDRRRGVSGCRRIGNDRRQRIGDLQDRWGGDVRSRQRVLDRGQHRPRQPR